MMNRHHRKFLAIWAAFDQVAEECIRRGGTVSIEWPTACAWWRHPKVMAFLDKHNFEGVKIHGCALGLVRSTKGTPIKKPWSISSTSVSYTHLTLPTIYSV